MAEQSEPVQRRVALKIVKPGMDTRQVIARFETERQALAMMDHPNIAKVFDAGTTESGRPYFVVELVGGTPITQYADEHRLTPQERLELFVPVCQAVQHAHQKGIIHRDIKPSNVIVAEYDDRPVPKIIDFGVAKAIDKRLTEKTMFTHYGQIVGTLEYMSPEQADLNQLDIDTRSDIYSLGVLLYELLTGQTPFDRERLHSAAFDELLRIIREEDPPRPSLRLSGSDSLPSIAANRKIEPKKLSTLIRGELDWMVMKALEKDRTRRYETANGFARDIQRYLADEPVEACPPSVWYRVRKFAYRNRTSAIIASLGVLLLIAVAVGGIVAAWQAGKIVEERNATLREQEGRLEALEREKEAARREATSTRYQTLALASFRWHEGEVGYADSILDKIPDDQRGWLWHFLKRLCHSESARFLVPQFHNPQAWYPQFHNRCVLSGDGCRVVLVEYARPKNVSGWDTATGRPTASFTAPAQVRALAADHTGMLAAIGFQNGPGEICDIATGKVIWRVPPQGSEIRGFAFSVTNDRVAMITATDVSVWDWKKGTQVFCEKISANSVGLSPTGDQVAAAAGTTLTVWNVADSKAVHRIRGIQRGSPIVFDRTQPRFACVADKTRDIQVRDLQTGEVVHQLRGHSGAVLALSFHPEGKLLVSGGVDKQLIVWDLNEGTRVRGIRGATEAIVAFDSSGERVHTVDWSRQIKSWDHTKDQLARRFPIEIASHAALSPSGNRLAVACLDTSFHVVETSSGKTLFSQQMETELPNAVAFSPDGKTVAVGSSIEGVISLWDVATGKKRASLPAEGKDWPSETVAFSHDGKLLAAGGRGQRVCVWDLASREKLHELTGHSHTVTQVVFGRDGRVLVSSSGGVVDGSLRKGPDGRLLPVTRGRNMLADIKIWDARTGKLLVSIDNLPSGNPAGKTRGMSLSADGEMVAAGFGDGSVRLYGTSNGELLRTLRGHFEAVWGVAFHPTEKRLLVTGDLRGTIKVWDATTGQEILSLGQHPEYVTSMEFSADGRRLVTTSHEDVRVWDATELENQE